MRIPPIPPTSVGGFFKFSLLESVRRQSRLGIASVRRASPNFSWGYVPEFSHRHEVGGIWEFSVCYFDSLSFLRVAMPFAFFGSSSIDRS